MTVIVLDTNALPHGQFSRSALDALMNVAGLGASIVIPEVVVWEWAEHALSAHVALEEEIRRYRVDAGVLTRPRIDAAPSIQELVERIEAALPQDVRIWRPEEMVWRTAVRDQVLQIGSGEAKSGIKTGASDAIVLACVEHESDRADSAVVLVTNDKQLRKNARRENIRFASGAGGLLSVLRTFVPATDDLALRLSEDLPGFLNDRVGDDGEALSFRNHGVAVYIDGDYFGRTREDKLSSLFITQVDIAEVDDLRVEAEGDERLGLAELRVFGTIFGDVLTYREVSPGEVGATRETVDFSSLFVDVTIEVRWDHNWRIQNVVATGVAVLVYAEPEDDQDELDVLRFRAKPAE